VRDFARDDLAWADFLISKSALILASVIFFAALCNLIAGFKELETREKLDFLVLDFKNAVDEVGSGNSESGSYRSGNSESGSYRSGNSESGSYRSGNSESNSYGSGDSGSRGDVESDNYQTRDQQGFQRELQSGRMDALDESHESFYCFSEQEIFRDLPFTEDIKVRISGEYVCLEADLGERNFRAVKPFAFRVLPLNESMLHEKLSVEFGAPGNEKTPLTADYSEIKIFLQALGTEEAVLNPSENISLKKKLIYVKDEEGISAFGCVLVYQ